MLVAAIFNLTLNTLFSFLAGLFVVCISVRILKIDDSQIKLFILSLPFIKVLWDLARGIPDNSILNTAINPLLLPPKHGLLTIGAGASEFGPHINVAFASKDLSGNVHALTIPDYLFYYLSRFNIFSVSFPTLIIGVITLISVFFIARRLLYAVSFELKRQKEMKSCVALEKRKLGKRELRIYQSKMFCGTPFTGGIIRPYICIPEQTMNILSKEELEAVILHEISHIKSYDLLSSFFIQIMGDLFWFIPGYSLLKNKIERLREILADRGALSLGSKPIQLASALLKIKTENFIDQPLAIYSALIRRKSLLKDRVELLLEQQKRPVPRWAWRKAPTRYFLLFWIVGAVLMSSFAGNNQKKYSSDPLSAFYQKLKDWGLR